MANKRKFHAGKAAPGKDNKRAKAKHYSSQTSNALSDFTRGHEAVLCTCDPGKEKQCRREMIDALERMHEELYGTQPQPQPQQTSSLKDEDTQRSNNTSADATANAAKSDPQPQLSVASALQAELAALKAEQAPFMSRHRAGKQSESESESDSDSDSSNESNDDDAQPIDANQSTTDQVHSSAKKPKSKSRPQKPKAPASKFAFASEFNYRGVVLLLNTQPTQYSLMKLVQRLLHRSLHDKLQLTRYTVRLEPIAETCFSSMDALCASAEKQLSTTLNASDAQSCDYAIVLQRRGENEKMTRDLVIQKIAALVDESKRHKVNLKQPKTVLLIQVAGRMSAMCVVPQWQELMRYNLRLCIETACGIVQQPPIKQKVKKEATAQATSQTTTDAKTIKTSSPVKSEGIAASVSSTSNSANPKSPLAASKSASPRLAAVKQEKQAVKML